ncbi:CaiB/BaiF CoA transferase family protein [Rhodococcoides fascians]|uniref:CaiB/BaiF CoA transferase family protein n=1 Tax=Rhodococcoides fascians TaxID=1828 RepID=UPI0009B8835D|nr:CoA transferase [Rhodococcus sp. 15-1189-1-1a]OZF15440.1 CoA transferase [Rhodococcus sp. 14-2686-1-2]
MMGGLAYMTGPPGQPLRAGASVNDVMGGMFGAVAIMAALQERTRTGRGQLVKSSLFENNAFLVGQHIAQLAVTGIPARPMPARQSAWSVYDVFTTEEEEKIFIGVVSDRQWVIFCDAFGLTELAADQTLSTNAQRVAARDRVMPILREVIASHTLDEAIAVCEKATLPFAPIKRPEDLLEDPHLAEPGAMVHVSSEGRHMALPALPIEIGGQRLGVRLDIPRVGEHTTSIARELGLDDADIAALFDAGVLGTEPVGAAS